jgi:hypothetical protein
MASRYYTPGSKAANSLIDLVNVNAKVKFSRFVCVDSR